ncbi:FkbM family methyltransferase [Pendulispora rubella]|uniref:FkbM family methyltransferase n=1 Tax=Pendulispora rubella TaxID=2741070 RepID=A0ABZ2L9X3_9BACT
MAETATFKLPNGIEVFHLNAGETSFLYEEIFTRHAYCRHGITLHPGACVFDVGANIGIASLFFLEAARDIKVYAFEPIPDLFRLLRANLLSYGGRGKAFNVGLSQKSGSAKFTFYQNNSIMSGQYADLAEDGAVGAAFMSNVGMSAESAEFLARKQLQQKTVLCRLKRLSEIIASEHVERIDLLKVDVEKGEGDVFAGIDAADWSRIHQVVVEVHDRDGRLDAMRQLLHEHGFACSVEQDETLRSTCIHSIFARRP